MWTYFIDSKKSQEFKNIKMYIKNLKGLAVGCAEIILKCGQIEITHKSIQVF